MFHVILHTPEIPPNTGNVIRLCANTGSTLHLVEPLGFAVDDARLRRAGLDYHERTAVQVHPDWEHCRAALGGARIFAYSRRGEHWHTEAALEPGDALLFGCETAGLPPALLESLPPERRLRLPMVPGNRSLNLGNSVAVAVYEGWRQNGFAGGA